jgi:GTP cyclohydrolase II
VKSFCSDVKQDMIHQNYILQAIRSCAAIGSNMIEANEKLGLPKDSRNYIDAIWIFKAIHINDFYLMSNNPEKINALTKAGFSFNILQVGVTTNSHNQQYLADKIEIGKHTIKLN